MTAVRRSTGITTRRAVCRILGSADSLPERSKASKVLTIIACRLQLFVFELERARCEHFGLGVEQLLERCNEHCQLLGVASRQGGGVQSGYALLSELSQLLQELEASVLLLPGQLGSDARYKPAFDELQALLANVSHYRTECENTKRHLEAALSELVHGCTTRATSPGAAAAAASLLGGGTAAQASTPSPQPGLLSECSGITTSGAQGGEVDVGVSDDAGIEIAVLHRVRQVICGLDLDVDMAERNAQDLDEELVQLRDQMQQALQELDPQPAGAQQGASVRSGARRRREETAAGAADTAPYWASASWASLPSASSMSVGGGGSLLGEGGGEGGGGASRLHAARHVSRRLAAQHLARLKDKQRQLRLAAVAAAAGGDYADADAQPVARRRRVELDSEGRGASGPTGTASIAFGRELRSPAGLAAPAPPRPGPDPELTGRVTGVGGTASRELGVASEGGSALESGSSAGGYDDATVAAGASSSGAPRSSAPSRVPRNIRSQTEPELSAAAEAVAADAPRGLAAPRQQAGAAVAAATGADVAAGASQPGSPSRRSTEASVAALRKLNRVTQLAGMWEAGRPVAQQASADDDDGVGNGSGSLSDYVERGSARSDGDDGSDAGGELPARPALRWPAPAAPPACAAAPPPPLLPGLPVHPDPVGGVACSSPFYMLALQGRVPKAPPVQGGLLSPPTDWELPLEETRALPAARARAGGGNSSPLGSPTAAAAGAFGVQRLRGAAAGGAAAPAPLPLPDASVHLRAVGLPGCFTPHWGPPGPFGLPAHAAAAAAAAGAAGGLWRLGGVGEVPAARDGESRGGGNGRGGEQLLDLGPDVPTLDLHRDITGWGPCLGRGAFGAVYKAIFRNKPAAVKVLHGGALDARDVRSLRTEISLLCRLRHHPNIITVYGAAAAPPDHVALVTELMDCDLYDYIHRRRQNCVPLDEVLSIARAIASGLSELHPAIVHRDLKPANVLLKHSAPHHHHQHQQQQGAAAAAAGPSALDRRLTVKIADFGLARHKRSQYLSTRERDAGTLKYMAPECIATSGGSGGGDGNGNDGGEGTGGGGVTEKCDIYSFGVLLYELITGREPWEGCHPLYAMCQVQSGVTLQLPDDPTRCPPSLRALVLRCWAYQYHQRPSSREVLAELDDLIAARQQEVAEGGGGALAEAHAPPLWQ